MHAATDHIGAGFVQAKDQIERGKAFRYSFEQAASLDAFPDSADEFQRKLGLITLAFLLLLNPSDDQD